MTEAQRPVAPAAGQADARATAAREPSVILGGAGTGQKGIYMDTQQIPASLAEPTMQAGQPAPPTTATEPSTQPSSNPE